jgi:putative FmdB family regulatory protein
MPTYRYKCKQCGYTLDVFQNMTENPLVKCEQCGGELVKLITSGAGFILKGEGFYVNDYKRKSQTCPAKSEKNSKTSEKSACADCQS